MGKAQDEIPQGKLRGLEAKFHNLLKHTSLQDGNHAPITKSDDNLYHVGLMSGPTGVWLEEPNRRRLVREGESEPRWCQLVCSENEVTDVVKVIMELCPGISKGRVERSLMDLVESMFVDAASRQEIAPPLESVLDVIDESEIGPGLEKVVLDLNSNRVPQIVYVPIEGVDFDMPTTTIGEVTLHRRNGASELDKVLQALESKTKRPWRELLEHVKCYATITIKGDSEYVREIAVSKVAQVTHVLNLLLSSPRYQPSWARIQISRFIVNRASPTDRPENDRLGIELGHSGRRKLEMKLDQLGHLFGHIYDASFSAKPQWQRDKDSEEHIQRGLKELGDIIQENNEIRSRVKRAVAWYSRAVDADSEAEKYVNLAIALESMLVGDEGKGRYATTGSITQTISERAAFLLGEDFDRRHKIERKVRELYGLRSMIIHTGIEPTKEGVGDMEELVRRIIFAFIGHDFDKWKDFREWVARQTYSTESETPPD